jgi:hypothetical protein
LNNQTEYNFNDLVKKADAALDNNNWQPVLADLANFENFKGNNEEAKILESIKRQANYPDANKTDDYKQSDEFHQDQQKIRMAAFSSQVKTNTANVLTKQQQVENYFANSQLRFESEELKTEIKNNLLSQPTWPGTEVVKTLEQFYWNLDKDTKVFKYSHSLNWQHFINFISCYGTLRLLLPVFQAFPTPESRAEFMHFTNPYTQGLSLQDQGITLLYLLPVFQAFPTDSELKFNFRSFTNLHKERLQQNYARFAKYLPFSFIDRNYLNYMRSVAALGAEPNASAARVQQVYETGLEDLLPSSFAEDPLMRELQAAAGVANAHDFDSIYPAEFEILKQKVDILGYQNQPSTHVYTLYNGQNILNNYKTNSEVEDFLKYLDSEFLASTPEISVNGTKYKAKEIISLVKQMLGLQPKASTTSGGFAPYLGSSMLYAKPDSPKGDEVLGRVWFLMNNIISEKFIADAAAANDAETLKAIRNDRNANCRSVVLAILEAAELSNTNAQTHCQTRLTGELLKITSWHLEHSKLRKLIAHDDSLEVNSDADIRMRIKAAPAKADSLFKAIHTTSPNVKKLWGKHLTLGSKPELFELEMTYYDDLYGRTPVLDTADQLQVTRHGIIAYKKDEHILERDDLGNLVKKYNADVSLKRNAMGAEEPEIVYYQAEFAVLEHEFTKRMKAEFEDQRGLVY